MHPKPEIMLEHSHQSFLGCKERELSTKFFDKVAYTTEVIVKHDLQDISFPPT